MATHLPRPGRPIPSATYRLQLHAGFGFAEAAAVAGYLAELGVTHLYLSPVLRAVPGSPHGYDIVDHAQLNPELGGAAGFARLAEDSRAAGLGLVLDVVPNHMAVPTPESLNAVLWSVLEAGRQAAAAQWFDVDWDAQDGRLLLPVLGAPLDECLDRGELWAGDGVLHYHDHRFPVPDFTGDVRALLDKVPYRLGYWRQADEELNYRRFFDVGTLIAIRAEDPLVWAASHELVLELARSGSVQGLRIDHPDGLADPAGYLARLAEASGGCWTVVEKILQFDEELPPGWACAGSTGYDALNRVCGVLLDPTGEPALSALYRSFTGDPDEFAAVSAAAKREVVQQLLQAEVERLLRVAARLGGDPDGLRPALRELLAASTVYRAYVRDDPDQAARQLEAAENRAAARVAAPEALRWVKQAALGRLAGPCQLAEPGPDAAEFATRFAQTTGAVMAKGVEDTAFYRYGRLLALNEVGGDPERFGVALDDFHEFCRRIAADWPATMTTLSTHDTKRSEDVRARLVALAELAGEWADAVSGWSTAAARYRTGEWPDRGTEYLMWQTLVGAWPISVERMLRYLQKATREAKRHTSWVDPNPAYERAVSDFAGGVLADPALRDAIEGFVQSRLLVPGRVNSLGQKLLQLTMPGVPDVYQGCELWDVSLVDPDNRRPVDYPVRRRLLAQLDEGEPPPALPDDEHGMSKLLVVSRALRLRRSRPEWFGPAAGYQPLAAQGPAAGHVLAFRRERAVSAATRFPVGLQRRGGLADTALPLGPGRWRDAFTDRVHVGSLPLMSDVFADLPVALLVPAA